MAKGVYKQLLDAADTEVQSIDADVLSTRRHEDGFVLVDVRDIRELQRAKA